MEQTALMVIDVQAELFGKSKPVYRAERLITNINKLIDHFHRVGFPVVFIRHSNGKALLEGTPGWELHGGLHVTEQDILLGKMVGNALAEEAIASTLRDMGTRTVVVSGLVTHGCVKATCEGALKLGYSVILAADGHSSYNADASTLIELWNSKLRDAGVDVVETDEIVRRIQTEGT